MFDREKSSGKLYILKNSDWCLDSLYSNPLIFVPRSPDDVYPPLREDEQDDYLLNDLEMDFSSTSIIPPVGHVTFSPRPTPAQGSAALNAVDPPLMRVK